MLVPTAWVLLAFSDPRAHCLLGLLPIRTPRNFSIDLLPSQSVPSLYHCQVLFVLKCITQPFSLLNFVRFSLAFPSCLARSLWKIALPLGISTVRFRIWCSLQTWQAYLLSPPGFLVEMFNRMGPRIDPCSTLLTTDFQVGYDPLTATFRA